MKLCVFLMAITCATPLAHGQFPDQFYTSGKEIDVWTREAGAKSILWFSRAPGEQISYRQSLVRIFDNQPEWAYYVNLGTRKYVGRYSFRQDKYAWLPDDKQRENIRDIQEEDFGQLGGLPPVDQLLNRPGDPPVNQNPLLDPPPTKEFPQLQTSSWDSVYFTKERRAIRARVILQNATGTYTFNDAGNAYRGNLTNVRYLADAQGLFVIQGNWTLGNRSGYFVFRIVPENLNLFSGEWGADRIEGTWSGTRVRTD